MYSETEGSRKAIGDVDVLYHDGLYHLFHLVLPNHDFIAHAVSQDGISWRRVNNALFIGDPGSWDDLMLWTMHVSPDPHRPGCWRMFYTGLSRRDQGHVQRIGLAESTDLFNWRKAPVHWEDHRGPRDPDLVKEIVKLHRVNESDARHAPFDADSCYPLQADPEFYESHLNEGRGWVSFRDPFFYTENGKGWLLAAGRVKDGPVIRRGCVSAYKEVEPHKFEARKELHHPRIYDDIEVPNLLKIRDEYYLIGSIREDSKIRYWHTDKIGNPWRSYHDNVLMAAGNYAGRICRDDKGWLIWNFFSMQGSDRTTDNLMPPPKRLTVNQHGLLRATTFEILNEWLRDEVDTRCVASLKAGAVEQFCSAQPEQLELQRDAGFQAFVFEEPLSSFRFCAHLKLHGHGKCGLVFRVDPETHDGYYLSLDLLKGVAQLRSWKTGPPGSGEHMMQFRSLQSGNWHSAKHLEAEIQLIAFGSYVECSINGRVILSLVDRDFSEGLMGVYLESAHLVLSNLKLNRMQPPVQSDDHLVTG